MDGRETLSTTLIHRRRRRRVLRRSPLRPLRAPPNGGNCSIRGATRRRHADSGLLMVQNPPLRLGVKVAAVRGARPAGVKVAAVRGGGGRACCLGATPRHVRTRHGGNCSIRGATRRRHADSGLLMVQNPPLRLGGEGGCGARREASGGEGGCGARGRRQSLAGLRDRPLRAALACGDLAGGPPPPSAWKLGGGPRAARKLGGGRSCGGSVGGPLAARKLGGGRPRGSWAAGC